MPQDNSSAPVADLRSGRFVALSDASSRRPDRLTHQHKGSQCDVGTNTARSNHASASSDCRRAIRHGLIEHWLLCFRLTRRVHSPVYSVLRIAFASVSVTGLLLRTRSLVCIAVGSARQRQVLGFNRQTFTSPISRFPAVRPFAHKRNHCQSSPARVSRQ